MSTHDDEMNRRYEEGKKLYQQRKFSESEALFSTLAKDKKYCPAGFYGLGVVHYALGKNETAEQHFKRCLEGVPEDIVCADALHFLGLIALSRSDIVGSLQFHREALRKTPEHYGSTRQIDSLERYMLQHAKSLYRWRKFYESKRAFQLLTQSRNYKAAALYGLGVIEFQKGDHAAAAETFNQCLNLHPRHANAWYYLGRIAAKKKLSNDKVRGFYKKALEINSAHSGALAGVQQLHGDGKRKPPNRGKN